MSKKQILQKTKLCANISTNALTNLRAKSLANVFAKGFDKAFAKSLTKQKPLIQILSKPKILALLFYSLFAVFGLFVLGISPLSANQTKPDPAVFPQYECTEPKKFSKTQRDNIIYAYNFGAPHGMGYTLAAIAWQESCAGVYMMNFSDPSAGLYHAHIPVVLKYYSKYEDNAFTRNVMGQMLIDNRLFASQIALDTLLYWQKYHKGNHKNTIKSYNKGFKWQKDKENNTLAESYYNSVSKKMRALETYIPRYSRVKNQSLFVELEDKNKHLEQTFRTLQNAKKIEKKEPKQPTKQESKPNITPNITQNAISATPTTQTHPATATQKTQPAQPAQTTKTTNPPKEQESTKDITKQPKKPPIKPFIEPKKDAPKQRFNEGLDNDDFIELPITQRNINELSPKTKLAKNYATTNASTSTNTSANTSANTSPQNRTNKSNSPNNASQLSQKIQKLDELFDDFNLIFEGN